jgi:23S rRNA pseudouridine2605 synthase
MRINKFVASATGLSRRTADTAIAAGRVTINGNEPAFGQEVEPQDEVMIDGEVITILDKQTLILNKPVGYVTSRDGQGARTVYHLLPPELHHLKPVGRLDKESSGLLLMTNDGDLAQQLTHPSYHKAKTYEVRIDKPLAPLHRQMISDMGIQLDDGPSKLSLERIEDGDDKGWRITMHEGRNRQIRRTFSALGYNVQRLHRTSFGAYQLGNLASGQTKAV